MKNLVVYPVLLITSPEKPPRLSFWVEMRVLMRNQGSDDIFLYGSEVEMTWIHKEVIEVITKKEVPA